jgi:hypothetical protein
MYRLLLECISCTEDVQDQVCAHKTYCERMLIIRDLVVLSRYDDSLRAGRSGDRTPRGGRFSGPSRPARRLTQPPVRWVSGLFPGGKAAEGWCWPLNPICAEVKQGYSLPLPPHCACLASNGTAFEFTIWFYISHFQN